jgi:hypothetical protein
MEREKKKQPRTQVHFSKKLEKNVSFVSSLATKKKVQ